MRIRKRYIAINVIIFAGLFAYWDYARHNLLFRSFKTCLETEFTQMPPDDHRLQRWLKVQSGIVEHTVLIERPNLGKNQLRIQFTQTRNFAGEPQIPHLEQACQEFGYLGLVGPLPFCPK